MAPAIPGFYYDPEKGKYFKIEPNHASPAGSAYSAQDVKRRKIEAGEKSRVRKRERLTKRMIKRSAILADPLLGGFLARELGELRIDVQQASWARGLEQKGNVPLVFHPPERRRTSPNVPHFWIGGHDTKTGLGVAYGTVDGNTLLASYIPTDSNDKIEFKPEPSNRLQRHFGLKTELITTQNISSITYHEATHKMLLTSREATPTCGVSFFSPVLSEDDDTNRPQWLLGETDHFGRTFITSFHENPGSPQERWVNCNAPAPAGASGLVCVLGTNHGIMKFQRDEQVPWVEHLGWVTPRDMSADRSLRTLQDVRSLDFLAGDPNVLLAGGRAGRVWLLDLRAPPEQWEWIRHHRGAVAHVRAVGRHEVLAAGTESHMSLYDIRYRTRRPNGTRPLVRFPGYAVTGTLDAGLDVSAELGVVAAAQEDSNEDGCVALHSLRSGARLPSPAVDGIQAAGTVKSVMFQSLPGERTPSLFVGVGPYIEKFSFGGAALEEA